MDRDDALEKLKNDLLLKLKVEYYPQIDDDSLKRMAGFFDQARNERQVRIIYAFLADYYFMK